MGEIMGIESQIAAQKEKERKAQLEKLERAKEKEVERNERQKEKELERIERQKEKQSDRWFTAKLLIIGAVIGAALAQLFKFIFA